ncbi:MAG: gliding motility-associated C-terminal domain-containing protein [Saprospirales bacterium]|nr:gliding motility-associated C-terminal domain-containing protein [Saprospirales bacterium]
MSNPIAAGGTYSFQVTDINGCAVIVVEDPSPVICNCSSAVGQMDLALIEECGDGPVTATYNVLGQNFDGDDLLEFVLHTGSGNTLEYPLIARSDSPIFSFDPLTMSYGTTYYISAIVGSDDGAGSVNDLADPCMAVAPGTPVIFHLVPTAVLSGTQDICLGDNAVLPIVLTGDAPWSVTVSDGTTSLTQSGINSTNYNFVIPAPAGKPPYTITAMNDEHCTGPISGTATVTVNVAPVNDVPVVTINSTNTGYVVCFNISGGEAPYTVTDGVNMWTTNGPFCSDELPCGSGYNFSYDDPNGCGPVVVAEPLVECDCTTSVGQLDPAAQEICGQGPAVVAYDATGQVLDGDDVVDFILHNGNQVPILTSTVASFTYSGLLTYGVTYFISARVGNNDGNGGVDPLDPCLAITPGTPVVFYEIPSATLSGGGDFCAGDQVDLTVTITGGTAPWDITYTNTQNQQATISISSSPFTFQVTPTGPTLYTLISVEDDHCIGANVVGIAPFTEQSQPFGVSPLITTDPTNTFVTICFTLAGGDPATYAVNGWPGTLTGNQFCSDPIPCDQGSYQFLIQDGFGCGTDTIAGPIICNCGSGAGIMDQNSQLVCEFQPISVPAAFAVQLDGNDALMYVLHTGNGTALGTILLTSPTPDFNYDPAILDCDQTYYISSVAGDDLGGGQVDLNDDCLSVSEGTPVVFHCEPSASISGGGAICEGQSIDGVFSFTGTNPFTVVINDGTQDITLNNLDTGSEWSLSPSQTTTYTLVTVQDSTGCSNTATGSITVTVNSPVFAGTANPPLTLCSGVGQLINLAGLLTGADPGGVWTETSAAPSTGGAFNAGAGTFNTAGQAPNNYTFRYLMDGIPPCADDNETVTVIIHQLPLADAGAVQELTCDATTAQIGGSGTSTGAQFSYEWTLVGSSNVIGMQTTLSVGQAGTYQLTVINTQTGCESSDQVVVTQSIETPQPVIATEDVSCFGAADGFIQIESATGGKPPYMFALNGGAFGDQQQFTGLSGGDYLISVQDANGCETQVLVTVIEPQELTATLVANILPDSEGNFVIEWGDELDLNLQSTLPIADLDTIIWSPADLVACNDVFCSSVTVAPQEGTTFTVSIEKGPCSASDQFRILVKTPRDVFIPNIFSPNLDGQNDVFFIQAGKQIAQIRSFLVFDRWGGSVFRADNFQPNDITIGWDGYYRGKLAAIGVYAYFVEVEYVDGHVEILEGDVTLVR